MDQDPEVWYGVVTSHDPRHAPPLRAGDHPFLRGMGGRFLRVITVGAVDRTYAVGEPVVREGEPADHLYLVFHGQLALEVEEGEHARRVLDLIGPGEVLGWSSILPLNLWPFDARAIKETRIVSIRAQVLRRALESGPAEAYRFLQHVISVVGHRLEDARTDLGMSRGRLTSAGVRTSH